MSERVEKVRYFFSKTKLIRSLYISMLKGRLRRKKKCFFGKKSKIDTVSVFGEHDEIWGRVTDSNLEDFVSIHGSLFYSSIGRGSYIGGGSKIEFARIGRFCSIAQNVTVIRGKHPSHDFVSTSPSFYSPKSPNGLSFVEGDKSIFDEYSWVDKNVSIEIGNDVWIGQNACIMEGTTIGDGAIVAAGSYVVKSVPPYAIVGGVPAKIIRYRTSEDNIKKLLEVKWWDKEIDYLKEHCDDFTNFDKFLNNLEDC